MDFVIASQVLLWLGFVLMAVALFALTRQVGLLHERLPAMGALVEGAGPVKGDAAPRLTLSDATGEPFEVGAPNERGRRTLLLFVAGSCPICKRILPFLQSFAAAESVDPVLVVDEGPEVALRMTEGHGLRGVPMLNSPQVGLAFRVGKLPHAVLLDPDGVILASGLVNSREHLESLVVSADTGYRSMQDFLTEERSESHVA